MSNDLFTFRDIELGYKDISTKKRDIESLYGFISEQERVSKILYSLRRGLHPQQDDFIERVQRRADTMKKIQMLKPKIGYLIDKVKEGLPWNEEDSKVILELKELYKTAVKEGIVKFFLIQLFGKPIKIWGDVITKSEAEEMIEERIQALREAYVEAGEDPTAIDSEKEMLKKQLCSLIKVQYVVIE